jgi:hypothetical protein
MQMSKQYKILIYLQKAHVTKALQQSTVALLLISAKTDNMQMRLQIIT